MAEPNPIWGVHVVPGAITGALVRRDPDGSFVVLDTLRTDAPVETGALLDATVAFLGRPGVKGRPALVAVPDGDVTVCTGWIPREQLHLNEDEVFGELHEFVPFEFGEGHLIYRSVGPADERRFLLAGIDHASYANVESLAQRLDGRFHGIGLATSASALGARALASVGALVVDVQADRTVALALAAAGPRRYVLAVGSQVLAAAPQHAQALARDLRRLAAYEIAWRKRADDQGGTEDGTPHGGIALIGAMSGLARAALAPHLGENLATTPQPDAGAAPVTDPAGHALAATDLATYGPAIGAAMEALGPAEDRLVIRHPPRDVPEYHEPSPSAVHRGPARGLLAVAAVVVAIVAVAFALRWLPGTSTAPPADDTGSDAPSETGHATETERIDLPGVRSAHVTPTGVRLTWGDALTQPARLERRLLPDGVWADALSLPEGATAAIDPLPPGRGRFAWRIVTDGAAGRPVAADVAIPVQVDVIGGRAGLARIRLARAIGEDSTAVAEMDAIVGARLVATSAPQAGSDGFVLDAGLTVTSIEVTRQTGARRVRVPVFGADGRVARNEDGSERRVERLVQRLVDGAEDVIEVLAENSEGAVSTWVRKMTDR